jgi:gamma-glutamylcyclotransferase (GGCT)/AIG2-like uncharacterized protein YtfP
MNESSQLIEPSGHPMEHLIRHFFYGSLMSNQYNNESLLQWDFATKIGKTSIPGFQLYDLGFFPCAQRTNNPNHVLYGEVWDLGLQGTSMVSWMERGSGYWKEIVDTEFGSAIIWTRNPTVGSRLVESGDWNNRINQSQLN